MLHHSQVYRVPRRFLIGCFSSCNHSLLHFSEINHNINNCNMCYRKRPSRRFESRVKQIVLVRNLPFHLDAHQLYEKFKYCGNIIAVDKQLGMTHGKCLQH